MQDDEIRVGGGTVDKVGPSSGSPLLAFTPTSVMRKNAAERKDSDPRPGVPELKISGGVGGGPEAEAAAGPISPGRPILKVSNLFLFSGFRIRIRTDPHVFALPGSGSGQKGKEMN